MKLPRITFLASLLALFLASSMACAEQVSPSAPSKMNPEEYAAYRAKISKQIEKKTAKKKAEQHKNNSDEATETWREPRSGYGQGYRARQERLGATKRNDAANRMSGRSR